MEYLLCDKLYVRKFYGEDNGGRYYFFDFIIEGVGLEKCSNLFKVFGCEVMSLSFKFRFV